MLLQVHHGVSGNQRAEPASIVSSANDGSFNLGLKPCFAAAVVVLGFLFV